MFVAPNWLLNVVLGRVLAPEGIDCDEFQPKNGVVTYSDIDAAFAEHGISADLVVNVLQYSHLCFKLPRTDDGQRRFMLPSHLEEEVDVSKEWRQEAGWPLYAGKRLLAENATLMLPPGFFPHVQTELHEAFGATVTLWCNAFKLMVGGVQCFGLIRSGREVDMWIRGRKSTESKARACLEHVRLKGGAR